MSAISKSGPLSLSGGFHTGGFTAGGLDQGTVPVDALVLHLNVTVTACSIYPETHPKASEAITDLQVSLERYLESTAAGSGTAFSLLVVDDELAIDGKPWRRSKVLCANLLRAMERHGVQRLTATAAVEPQEIVAAVVALTTGNGPQSSTNLEVGKLELLEEGDGDLTLGQLSLENRVDAVRAAFDTFVQGTSTSYQPLAEATRTLIDSVARTDQFVLINPELKTDGDRLFRHSLGTALGTAALAGSLGISGEVLVEITVGGLLHDVGLLHEGDSERASLWSEWKQRASEHPVLGAGQLAMVEDLPPLVLLVVLQHHQRVDGTGFPQLRVRINLAAAIVAVADAWDVLLNLSGTMPHALRWRFAQEQLGELAGGDLNEDLVALFLQIVGARPQVR